MKIDVKVTISNGVPLALEALGLRDGGEARKVAFLEDTTVGTDLPLFEEGLVLRVRQSGDGEVESTVKLRPCRASQLADEWLELTGDDGKRVVEVEQDWSGARRVLAASFDRDRAGVSLDEVFADGELNSKLLDDDQEGSSPACTGLAVKLDALTLLGPIDAVKWSDVPTLPGLGARAERWTVGGLDFLEISLREDEEKAEGAQRELEAALRLSGLGPFDEQRTKTETVLRHLAGALRR